MTPPYPKTGIILMNMGGPERQEDVGPFLYNLFSDREIIQLGPSLLQKPLACFIARKRAPKSRAMYRRIGGGSPLLSLTQRQAAALEKTLADEGDYTVVVSMRYWPPMADKALSRLLAEKVDSIIAVSLYPQYSKATTGSSVNHLKKHLQKLAPDLPLKIIDAYPDQPEYIKALADSIHTCMTRFNGDKVQILYSAHSLPVSFIRDGDPYVDHLNRTITALEKLTGLPGKLCFQSKSGPVEWLSPSTPEMLEQQAEAGTKNILMVPISFVSDHLETLYEINILYREKAEKMGMCLHSARPLNDHPEFILCLKQLVLQA
ncbi:ferrochelatase [Desulfomarina sp.]